jgi:hypothetical protein
MKPAKRAPDRTALSRRGDWQQNALAVAASPNTTNFGPQSYFGSQLQNTWYPWVLPIAAMLMRPLSSDIVTVQLNTPWTPSSTRRLRSCVTRSIVEARSGPSGLWAVMTCPLRSTVKICGAFIDAEVSRPQPRYRTARLSAFERCRQARRTIGTVTSRSSISFRSRVASLEPGAA